MATAAEKTQATRGRKPLSADEKAQRAEARKNEDPNARFIRLANQRVPAALKRVALVGNLFGPGYQWTEAQADRIITTLMEAVDQVRTKATASGKTDEQAFRL